MQSVAPQVLRCWTGRTHRAGRSTRRARRARPGFEHVNIDLIYGTPGETDDDLRRSLDTAVEARVDHVSAYALVVEDGTALARRVRRGELPALDDDVLAPGTNCSTRGCHRPASTGTRCPTGAGPAASAGTTWATGTAASGGAPGPAHTDTSARPAGGTSSTPTPMRRPGRRGGCPSPISRRSTPSRHTEEVLLGVRLRDGLALATLNGAERASGRRRRDRACCALSTTVWCSPIAVGCWPTRWSALCLSRSAVSVGLMHVFWRWIRCVQCDIYQFRGCTLLSG